MIIYLGSTRPAKVEGACEAIAAIAAIDPRFGDADVRPRDVTHTAPAMPMTEAEIVGGARGRAAELLRTVRRSGEQRPDQIIFAVGLEGGLDPLPPLEGVGGVRYTLKTWACVTDGTRWSDGAGGAVTLPDAIGREVVEGHELGDVIDRLAGSGVRGTRGAWGVLTRDLVGRRDAFRLAVMSAFAPFFNEDIYSR